MGTVENIALSIRSILREPEVGFRRVPFKGSPLYHLGLGSGV